MIYRCVFLLTIAFSWMAFAGEAVQSARLPSGGSWTGRAGLVDIDPSTYAKHSSTLTTSATATDVNNAITASGGGGKYIEFASGVFSFSSDILINLDGVELRGQVDANGLPATFFDFATGTDTVVMQKTDWDGGAAGDFTTRQISSGHTRGSTTLTLASAPTGLTAGRLMFIAAPTSPPDIDGEGGFTDFLGTYPCLIAVKVTSVSGNDVSFTPALNPSYLSGLTCHVYYRAAADQINHSGLQNIHLRVNGGSGYFSSTAVDIDGANQCFFRNCFFQGMGHVSQLNAFIYLYFSYRCEISHCKFYGTDAPGNSSQYAISSIFTSGPLVVNNEFTENSNAYPILVTSDLVFAYNYLHKMLYTANLSQWVFDHGGHNNFNLIEGNWNAGQHCMDGPTTGGNPSHSNSTLYNRNRIRGYDVESDDVFNNVNAIWYTDTGAHENVTVAANVLGVNGIQDAVAGGGGGNQGEMQGFIYNLNAATTAETDKLGNYNDVDQAIPASETAALGGNTVSTSYFYTSKPDFFGDRPWPWCDPNNFTQSNAYTNLPAGYLAFFGEDPPAEAGGGGTSGTVTVGAGTINLGGGRIQ